MTRLYSLRVLQKHATPYKTTGWQLHASQKVLAELSQKGYVTNLVVP